MILMYSEKGGYMNAANVKEVERLKAKGFEVVETPVKKTRKKRVKK